MSPATAVRCEACRRDLPGDAAFCPWCGSARPTPTVDLVLDTDAPRRDRPSAAGPSAPTAAPSARRWMAALVGAALGGLLWWQVGSGADRTPTSVPEGDTTATSVGPADATTGSGPSDATSGGPTGEATGGSVVPDGLRGRVVDVVTGDGSVVSVTLGEASTSASDDAIHADARAVLASPHGLVITDDDGTMRVRQPGGGTVLFGEGRAVVGADRLWSWDGGDSLSTAATTLTPLTQPGELDPPPPWVIDGLNVPVGVSDAGLLVHLPVSGELHLRRADGGFERLATGRLLGGAADVAVLSSCTFEGCGLVVARADGTVDRVAGVEPPRRSDLARGEDAVVSPDGRRMVVAPGPTSSAIVELDGGASAVEPEASEQVAVAIDAGTVVWDATSRFVLVPVARGILAVDAATGATTEIPVVLPDGQWPAVLIPTGRG